MGSGAIEITAKGSASKKRLKDADLGYQLRH